MELNYPEVWNNLFFSLNAKKLEARVFEEQLTKVLEDFDKTEAQTDISILKYKLDNGSSKAEKSYEAAIKALSKNEDHIIQNEGFKKQKVKMPQLPKSIVGLVHFGRSGTGLLHSLIDGHPNVSTFPSVYFSEFFAPRNWRDLTSQGWGQLTDRFIAKYDVLFDASSKVPIITSAFKLNNSFGIKEGLANVGENADEVLTVDKNHFRNNLNRLLEHYSEIDIFTFFQLVQAAYEEVINPGISKDLNFYHIHNPSPHAQLNFIRMAPHVKWIMMVRNPIQSCESWMIKEYLENDYLTVAAIIIDMLFEIDKVIYQHTNSIALKLEDLKNDPHKTIPALCKWLNIEETDSLYQMTAQGKKWWGDPSSPDYRQDGMAPFGKTSINRSVGKIFSENDQFILNTLFYPFRVKLGYTEANSKKFKNDSHAT